LKLEFRNNLAERVKFNVSNIGGGKLAEKRVLMLVTNTGQIEGGQKPGYGWKNSPFPMKNSRNGDIKSKWQA
jgi:hypothetical protein